MKLSEVCRCNDQGMTNEMLTDGWEFLGVTGDGMYHLGKPIEEPPLDDWRPMVARWLDNLDPDEIDRVVMANLSFDEKPTAGILRYLKEQLTGA